MAQKTLRNFSAPSASNGLVGPDVSNGGENFEIKTGLITMVQASPFCGKALLLSREFHKMLSGSDCFSFLFYVERSSGPMLTEVH